MHSVNVIDKSKGFAMLIYSPIISSFVSAAAIRCPPFYNDMGSFLALENFMWTVFTTVLPYCHIH